MGEHKKPSSIPKLLTSFPPLKTLSDTFENAVMSPTSILDNIPFSTIKCSFRPDQAYLKPQESDSTKKQWDKSIGLGLVDVLSDDKADSNTQVPEVKKMVFFRTKLKVHVPPLLFSTQTESLPPPIGDGTATGSSAAKEQALPETVAVLPRLLTAEEMELSEDYTCVISHVGPNPTTTHIFDNCILNKFHFSSINDPPTSPPHSFLSYCYTCKKNMDQRQDIYIYRGEMAFCSKECRHEVMLLDDDGA